MRKDLEKLFADYVDLPLECDGLTRVLSYLLDRNGVAHRVMQGSVSVGKKTFDPHFWIELLDGHVIDYRARMWFGNKPSVPHGIFRMKDFPEARYEGRQVSMTTSDFIFKVLTMG
jgi:hypothetical protein